LVIDDIKKVRQTIPNYLMVFDFKNKLHLPLNLLLALLNQAPIAEVFPNLAFLFLFDNTYIRQKI
jgi:hypothetical protein